MAKKSVSSNKFISIILIAIGIFLGVWGFQMSGSFESQMSQAFGGTYSDEVLTLFILGSLTFIIGLYLYLKK